MVPEEYFPTTYLHDLGVFYKDREPVPQHGRLGMLCGMTMGNLFEPDRRPQFASPEDFLCSLYVLNVINQGIHTYFPTLHSAWRRRSAPFIDTRGCSYGHGGWSGAPHSILRFAKDPSYIPGAEPVTLTNEELTQYTRFFLFRYLPSVLGDDGRDKLTPKGLLGHLMNDADCGEIRHFI